MTYNIFVSDFMGNSRLFAQTGDLAEAVKASDWIVNGSPDAGIPGLPGIAAAWVAPGDPGDILVPDSELLGEGNG